jgi:hypothetical protein
MNRLRIGLVGSFIIGCFYAAFGLFDSLGKFAAGIIVAALSIIAYGLTDYVESVHDNQLIAEREAVWARRDAD